MPVYPRYFDPAIYNILSATAGADQFSGAGLNDHVSYARAAGAITLDLAAPQLNTGWAKGDTFSSIEVFSGSRFGDIMRGDADSNTLLGEGGNDRLYGLGGNDQLKGGAGNDALDGGDGQDFLDGGAGADRLIGGASFDYADYQAATGRVVVNLMLPGVNEGEAKGDTYSSIEGIIGGTGNDDLTGDHTGNAINGLAGDDWIYGLDGDDAITAGEGNDRIEGGKGNDWMVGSLGQENPAESDTFFFYLSDFAPGSRDTIMDFNGLDQIVIQGVTRDSITLLNDVPGGEISALVIDLGNGASAQINVHIPNFSQILPPSIILI